MQHPSSSEFFVMKAFLTGVSCVGKTAIGAKLASLLGYRFFDLDHEIETFFGKPLERLQAECLSKHAFRKKTCQALRHLLAQDETQNSVVSLPHNTWSRSAARPSRSPGRHRRWPASDQRPGPAIGNPTRAPSTIALTRETRRRWR